MADLKKKEDELAAVQKILDQLNSEFEQATMEKQRLIH